MKIVHKGRTYVFNPTVQAETHLRYRRTERPVSDFRFSLIDPRPETQFLLRAVLASQRKGQLVRELGGHLELLVDAGLLVPDGSAPVTVTGRFELEPSMLQALPEPPSGRRAGVFFDRRHVVLQPSTRRPSVPFGALPPAGMAPRGERLAFIFDPGTHMWTYVHLAPELFRIAARLSRGTIEVSALSEESFALLRAAGILTDRPTVRARRALWEGLPRSRATLLRRGAGSVTQVFSPLQVAFLRGHTRALRREGYLRDATQGVQGPPRLCGDLDEVGGFIHRQSGALLRQLTGELVVPSWQLFSTYFGGSTLERHVDRDQCVWNVSVPIDSQVSPPRAVSPWPLGIQGNDGVKREYRLASGDLALYRGTRNPHWRPQLEVDRTETVMLWFFVPIDYAGDLNPYTGH